MLDWMTLSIEAVGVVIFCIWIVVPIREFRGILNRMRRRTPSDVAMRPGGGEDIPKTGRKEAGK